MTETIELKFWILYDIYLPDIISGPISFAKNNKHGERDFYKRTNSIQLSIKFQITFQVTTQKCKSRPIILEIVLKLLKGEV